MKYYKLLFLIYALFVSVACQSNDSSKVFIKEDRLYLIGTFHEGTLDTVVQYLDLNPGITMIVFTANGGSVHDSSTLALGREIRGRGLDTHLVNDGVLASGGLSLFLSGQRRTIGSGAMIGVHSWQRCWNVRTPAEECKDGREHPQNDPNHELHGTYTEEMLGSKDFYWFAIEAAPSTSIHWMLPTEIIEYQVVNSMVEPEGITNPFGSEFERERINVCGECKLPEPESNKTLHRINR